MSSSSQAPVGEQEDVVWRPPREGCVKVNWAVCVELDSRQCFLGILIRNHLSQVMGAMVMRLPVLPKGVHPNVSAIIQALKFAHDMGFQDIVLKGPKVSFMLPVGSVSVGPSVQDIWFEEVQVLRNQFSTFSVYASSKKSNATAVALARFGSSVSGPRVSVEDVPVELRVFCNAFGFQLYFLVVYQ